MKNSDRALDCGFHGERVCSSAQHTGSFSFQCITKEGALYCVLHRMVFFDMELPLQKRGHRDAINVDVKISTF